MLRQEPGATQLGLADRGLLSLVDELLLNIIDQIDSHKTLCNLAATCIRFQGLVEPYVWRNLLVLRGAHARSIAVALDSREERVDYIKELSIRYKDDYKDGIAELNHFMGLMGKLRHLTLESPCPNNSEWRSGVYFDGWSTIDYTNLLTSAVYPRQGLPLALPCLQSLTLHSHGAGDRKFSLGRAVAMFRHPTLRKITLSCLNFDGNMSLDDIPEDDRKSTPLQSLTLVECNVHVPFLAVVLSLPKALKELSIGERLHTFPECEPSMNPSTRTSSKQFLVALQQQAHSLQRLTHIGGHIGYQTPREIDPEGSTRLQSLTRLEHLELGLESSLYYYLRQNGFPPALKTLKMLDTAISLNASHDLRSLLEIVFRSLTSLVTEHLPAYLPKDFTLHMNFADHPFFSQLFFMEEVEEQNHIIATYFLNRPTVYKIATILKSSNSRFCISREKFSSGMSYIPPYMHGEELPVEEMMYDSDDYWRFNGYDYQTMDDEQLRGDFREQNRLFLCINCREHGLGVDQCLHLGDGSACLPCRIVHARACVYERIANEDTVSPVDLEAD
ncbi:uncharacterized protein K460DRAFT_404251 [Cucurbitaria berberidis CBS 394.84]|uniref:F-box domain-containing protein n=1 Tax=Cucurbitaria berberidis CBS 394.84 TaxID=1168544 RepID=A0A9P4GM97_9PLEO|nr:uncharacterized protein K460DRAFT_404251 [Cucurbitaria berberidis CBS 394.84]KAF1848998.1 hypothetical protein K460DRAFT_404251 [Cucurbitaria berberidis CBS 394.84]